MSFLGYNTPEEMLQKTGKTPQECLAIIDEELARIRNSRIEGTERHNERKTA